MTLDFSPGIDDIRQSVLQGLTAVPKVLPCKLLYDQEGSRLFEEICLLEEYYPTRTEISILDAYLRQMSLVIGPQALIIELGSGSGAKTRRLLRQLEAPVAYVPVEISRSQLDESSIFFAESFPSLEVLPVCADYMQEFRIPKPSRKPRRTVVYFPGSTIGNFMPDEAETFLARMGRLAGTGGGLLLGVDLNKDPHIIERAYNDSAGVTAAFNLNVLKRIASLFGLPDFSERFYHRAAFNQDHKRIEMQLISAEEHAILLDGIRVIFAKGETITTEYSYKWDLEQFFQLSDRAGLDICQVWTDRRKWFAVMYFAVSNTQTVAAIAAKKAALDSAFCRNLPRSSTVP